MGIAVRCVTACVVVLVIVTLWQSCHQQEEGGQHRLMGDAGLLRPRAANTLVIYVFSATDPEYAGNMHHFVRHGMAEGDGCEYVIVVQNPDGLPQV